MKAPVWRRLAALAAGAALPLAFAPIGWWPIAILAPACLFLLWERETAREAALTGWLFGLGYFGVGVSWVQISVHQFGLPVFAFSAGVTALLIMFLALYPLAVGYASRRWFGAGLRLHLLALPAAWVLGEWLRGWILSGFPWLALGYSQIDALLAGFAPVAGVYAVSAGCVLSAGCLAAAVRCRGGARMPPLVLLAVLWLVAWQLNGIEWTEQEGEPIDVALVQGNVAQAIKWEAGEREATMALYLRLTEPVLGRSLVVWPETAIPAFQVEAAGFIDRLEELARAAGTQMLVGVPMLDPAHGRYYNSVLALGDLPHRQVYHKRHLVPFGEFLPLRPLLEGALDFLDIPMSQFTPGDRAQASLQLRGLRAGVSICYEDVFPEEVIDALPEAGVLVNVSNDAWFGDSLAPHQHLEIARMRARETGRYLLRATNTGISAVIDQRGRVTADLPQFEPGVIDSEFRLFLGATPYVRTGNSTVVILALIALAAGAGLARRRAA